jgi:hypothetical protein
MLKTIQRDKGGMTLFLTHNELGVTLEWEDVKLLARLGGWVERKDSPPGKIVLTRGLRRWMGVLHTQAFLDRYREEWGLASSHCSLDRRATTVGVMAECQIGEISPISHPPS